MMPASDSLTGLPGRGAFFALVAEALARSEETVGVILIDIDGFGGVNAVLSAQMGDKVLIELATRLVREVGEKATVARYGGDEFAVVMAGCTAATLRELAQSCLAVVRQPLPGVQLLLTASVGTAIGPKDAAEEWELINFAGLAQFVAKTAGRDRVVAAKPLMRKQIERSVRDGVASGAFGFAYQPIVTLQGSPRLVGLEGFLRWHHPSRGLIFPGSFLPLLEDARMARLLATFALGEVAAQARLWLDRQLDIGQVALNLSAHQLREGGLVREIESALAERRVPLTMIALELPSDAYLLPDLASLRATLETLRARGITVTVDSGPSASFDLAALQRLPIDCIKLGRTFDKDPSVARTANIIQAIHAADLIVGAEGVETVEQHDLLASAGCDRAQGWRIGRPMPAGKLPAFITRLDVASAREAA